MNNSIVTALILALLSGLALDEMKYRRGLGRLAYGAIALALLSLAMLLLPDQLTSTVLNTFTQ